MIFLNTFRELYFRGSEHELKKFVSEIGKYVSGDWRFKISSIFSENYLSFDYIGGNVDNASVSIHLGEDEFKKGELMVGNIVPLTKSELNIDEYNKVLMQFYCDIIKPFKQCNSYIKISEPTDDIFDPLTVLSKEALKKLESFCHSANKATGSSHPCDRDRWFEFVCQTVDDNMAIGYDELARFLQDENYWGKTTEYGAWDKEQAYQLALEYELLFGAIEYYKKTRGK